MTLTLLDALSKLSGRFMKLAEGARKMGLEVNTEKTKYMVTEEIPRPGEEIRIREYTFGKIPKIMYLGSLIIQDNVVDSEIKRRVLCANCCYYSLSPYFMSCALSKDTKIYLYKTIIRPILLYGSETWTIIMIGGG
ncbi:uncharacterized protein [Halyomorpha halys]|uniref:uncharacterized protein n=1 Tax=Halyomorpha halys TaxID=286706 RepID=UPI0034D27B6B